MKPKKTMVEGWRQSWQWQATGVTAYNFLVQILPYLKEKAPQATEAIEFYHLYGGAGRGSRGIARPQRTLEQKHDQETRSMRIAALKIVEYAA